MGDIGLQHYPGRESTEGVPAVRFPQRWARAREEGGSGLVGGIVRVGGGREPAFVRLARGDKGRGAFYQFRSEQIEKIGNRYQTIYPAIDDPR